MSVDQQNAVLAQLNATGVHVIRAGITPGDKGIDFARRAQAQGIKIVMLVQLQYRADAPSKPWPNPYNTWGGHPLSSADPVVFRNYFEPLLAKLEAAGVTLAGFELGNEINAAPFNAEFSFPAENPGQPRQFNLDDLYHDPEGQQIAKGYLQYLSLLAVLKDVRNHSKFNQYTPIISAGLVCDEAPEGPRGKDKKLDMVSANATIEFMRANGSDKIVDAYGIHTYPWVDNPGTAKGAEGRQARLAEYVLAQCQPKGSDNGKPCWITEWGFPASQDESCSIPESHRVALIKETMDNFRPYVSQKKITGLFYYAWLDKQFGISAGKGLTEAGKWALGQRGGEVVFR